MDLLLLLIFLWIMRPGLSHRTTWHFAHNPRSNRIRRERQRRAQSPCNGSARTQEQLRELHVQSCQMCVGLRPLEQNGLVVIISADFTSRHLVPSLEVDRVRSLPSECIRTRFGPIQYCVRIEIGVWLLHWILRTLFRYSSPSPASGPLRTTELACGYGIILYSCGGMSPAR